MRGPPISGLALERAHGGALTAAMQLSQHVRIACANARNAAEARLPRVTNRTVAGHEGAYDGVKPVRTDDEIGLAGPPSGEAYAHPIDERFE
jgi:hypothetical protein